MKRQIKSIFTKPKSFIPIGKDSVQEATFVCLKKLYRQIDITIADMMASLNLAFNDIEVKVYPYRKEFVLKKTGFSLIIVKDIKTTIEENVVMFSYEIKEPWKNIK